MVYIIDFIFKTQINLMQFPKEFKVSEILCVIIFDIICASIFDTKCVHHTMEMPYGNCIKLNNHQCNLSQLKAHQI
jgi:hypothetical protein